jgi:undecaprenyl diphosphate synthase
MHVAIIMDGNGRWAARRTLPRTAGHVQGARAVRHIVEAAVRAGIGTLTLYAFSSDNWARPSAEVAALMRLLQQYLKAQTPDCAKQGVRLNVIGRRDRLSAGLLATIEESEQATARCSSLHLRIAVDYSARHSILQAARRLDALAADAERERELRRFLGLINEINHSAGAREVDLLIRTGGEKRLSDFLLWECAYAELYFTDCLWPDFDEGALRIALQDFAGRQRRFGGLPELHATPAPLAEVVVDCAGDAPLTPEAALAAAS